MSWESPRAMMNDGRWWLLVVDVFDQVSELNKRVVPLIKDEFLEVACDSRGEYKLRESGDARDMQLAERMEDMMLGRYASDSSLRGRNVHVV